MTCIKLIFWPKRRGQISHWFRQSETLNSWISVYCNADALLASATAPAGTRGRVSFHFLGRRLDLRPGPPLSPFCLFPFITRAFLFTIWEEAWARLCPFEQMPFKLDRSRKDRGREMKENRMVNGGPRGLIFHKSASGNYRPSAGVGFGPIKW